MANDIQKKTSDLTPWEQERDRIKRLWVISVLFFWFSAFFQIGLYIIDGQVNLVLISVISGMMVLGVVLKFRLQRHLRTKPDEKSTTDSEN